MALATSVPISLTDVRDFYGQSGSISMTNLHKGESNIPNPTTYGSSTVGTGSISVNATGTANTGASYLTTTLPVVPQNLYQYGGVVPSLDTEANQNFIQVMKEIYKNEGVGKLISGVYPRTFWITIGGFIYLGPLITVFISGID